MIRRLLVPLAIFGFIVSVDLAHDPTRSEVFAAGPSLNGGGSSFAKNEIDQWRAEVARKPLELQINYVAQGSSFGRQQYIAGTLDFAASDIPFTGGELDALNRTSRKDFAYVPVSAGGLGIMYNLIDRGGQQVTNLQLTRRSVCRMFTEPNLRWDDAEIQSVNPTVQLPAELIRPIVRSDGSGTSYVLSEFCLTVASDVWGAFIQRQQSDPSLDPAFARGEPVSNWPLNWGVVGSALAADGVAAAVADPSGRYSVTYNESGFAKLRGFPNASVQNAAGAFTQPTEEAVSIALGYAVGRPNGTFILNYTGEDPKAYFPSTYSYIIAQTTGFNADKGRVLALFLCYSVTKGQRLELTSKLGYARLSAPLVDIARVSIAKIPGAPPWEQCRVVSEAAPPAATTTLPSPGATTTTAPSGSGGAATTVPSGTTPAGGATGPGSSPIRPTQTSIVIDPVTGSSVVVAFDETGATIPFDESLIDGNVVDVPGVVGDATGTPAVAGSGGVAPAAINPTVDTSPPSPDPKTVAWWLIQGFAVCGLGAAVAGARRRTS
jgi:ABC-type phosphate transport system substrate-binding protein